MRLWKAGLACLMGLWASSLGADFHGRVIDRGTLQPGGSAKGIAGVQISVYDGKRLLASATTDARGRYRIRKVTVQKCKAVYKAKGFYPAEAERFYALVPGDTGSRDVYFDASLFQDGMPSMTGSPAMPDKKNARAKAKNAAKADPGYYPRLAHGILAVTGEESFFREDRDDSIPDLSTYFDGRDTSADYQGAMCELLWVDFLSEERPLETRYYLAASLAPILDSLKWGKPKTLTRYLDVTPEAVQSVSQDIHDALRTPKKLPTPKDLRKAKIPPVLAAQIAAQYVASEDLPEKIKAHFLAQWKKTWGKDLPPSDATESVFRPQAILDKLVAAKLDSPTLHYLRGRGLYAAKDYTGAAEEMDAANRLQGGHAAARYWEAMAYLKLGRDQEALGRFQALREAPDPFWKAKGFRGLGVIAEKEQRHSEAASNLAKSIKLWPDAEALYVLAEVSLKLNDHADVEKQLEQRVAHDPGDHLAHYWLGRYAEEAKQDGPAQEHFCKAWEASPSAEYGEALGRIYLAREEYGPALGVLEPVKEWLSSEGRRNYGECLLRAGRFAEAAKEYAAVYAASPGPELLGRYVESLVETNRADEALALANASPDPTHPAVRLALAKAELGNRNVTKARPILEDLLKREDKNPEFHHGMGLVEYEDRNYDAAKREFDEALAIKHDYPDAIYYSGLTLIKLGKAEAARNYFNELIRTSSRGWKAKGLMGAGLAFSALQKPEAAENFFEKSIAVEESAEAEAMLAMSRSRLEKPDSWVPQAKKAYALDPKLPKAVLVMSDALMAQGKKSQAVRLVQKALEANPTSCELLAGLAKGQYLTGTYADSRNTGASAITLCPQEPEAYYYAAVSADKLQDRKEAEDYFKGFRKAGGDEGRLPEDYRDPKE